jgi:septal ring factor EnvC (AmiA/AmiB activator)
MFDGTFRWAADLCARLPPMLQGIVLAMLLYIIVHLQVRKYKLKFALQQRSFELDRKNLELEKTKTQLSDVQQRAEKLDQETKELRESFGGSQQKLTLTVQQLEETQGQLEYAETDRAALEERFDQLQRLDANIWCSACTSDFSPPKFVARQERKTIFVAVQNLKGGVGKTTLVANLGASYAIGVIGTPLRTLMLDLDFQGTLSNCCVERKDLDYQWRVPCEIECAAC